MLLSRDDILKADDLPTEEVDLSDLPGYNGSVLVRGLTGRERDEYFASLSIFRGGKQVMDVENATAKLVARCVVGEDGEPLFTAQDTWALGQKSGAALDRISEAAQRLSGLSQADMDEIKKGSEPTPDGGSPSPSPGTSGRRSKPS